MRPFLPLIIVVLLCCSALFFGGFLFDTEKYVMLSYGKFYVKATLFSSLLMLAGLWIAVRLVIFSVKKTLGVVSSTRSYFFSKGEKKAREDLRQGLTAFLLQDWGRAEKLISGAGENSGLPESRHLFAAAAADALGDDERVQAHLLHVDPDDKDVTLFKADLLLKQNEPEQAQAVLQPLYEKKPKDAAIFSLYVKILTELPQWDELLAMLGKIDKAGIYADAQFTAFSLQVVDNALRETAHSKTIAAVEQQWNKLPGKLKKRHDILSAYLVVLAANGKSEQAETLLLKALKKASVTDFMTVFRLARFSQPTALHEYLHNALKNNENDPQLLYALGHLAARSDDHVLASKALAKAVEHQPLKADLQVLADSYSRMGEHARAVGVYKQLNG
jgi:heme biosynthesis-associated TPR repeat protein